MIVIAGIGRNIGHCVKYLRASFDSYNDISVYLLTNNNTDDTIERLEEWKNENPRVYISEKAYTRDEQLALCQSHTWDHKPNRMEWIAYLRNELVMWLQTKVPSEVEYIVMLDLDNPNVFDVPMMKEVIDKYHNQFDVLSCYGTEDGRGMYDAYAFRSAQAPFGPELMGDRFWDWQHLQSVKESIHPDATGLVPVYAAFNGCCVIRRELLPFVKYSAFVTKAMNDWYRHHPQHFAQLIRLQQHSPLKVATHHQGVLLGEYKFGMMEDGSTPDGGIWWHNNSGYSFPIVCEHITMMFGLRARGFVRVFVAPEWKVKWTR